MGKVNAKRLDRVKVGRGEGQGGGGVAGPQPMSTAVHRSPNKLWRSNSIFNLCKR